MVNPRRLVKFSVEHPWIVILVVIIITAALVFPLTNLKVQADVESLLPEDFNGFKDELSDSSETFDKLLVMIKGDELFRVHTLQLFESTITNLKKTLSVTDSADPFSMVTLEKVGARLAAVPMAPGGKAPVDNDSLAIFRERLKQSRFAPGFVCSKDHDALAVYLLVENLIVILIQ